MALAPCHCLFQFYVAEGRLSYLIYLLPAALLYFAYQVRNCPERSALRLLLAWTLALATVTLLQRRFFNSFSVALSLVMGWGFAVAVARSCSTAACRRAACSACSNAARVFSRPAIAGGATNIQLNIIGERGYGLPRDLRPQQ